MEIGVLALIRALLEWKYMAIIIAFFLDGTISPVPGELILIFAGYLLYLGQLNFLLTVLSATIGSLAAAAFLYELSRKYGEMVFIKYAKYVFLNKEHLHKAQSWFRKYGERTVFIGRLLPVISQIISIPAGMAKMGRVKFLLYTAAGSMIWYSIVTLLSWYLGSKWHLLLQYIKPFQLAFLVIIVCVAVSIILRKLFGRHIDRIARQLDL